MTKAGILTFPVYDPLVWGWLMFTLRLRNFWESAGNPNGFFANLAQRAFEDRVRVVCDHEPADLEIVAAYPSTKALIFGRLKSKLMHPKTDFRWTDQNFIRPKMRRSIWFTAENLRPPASDDWSGFLSFEMDSLGGRNAYLPLWMLDLEDFNPEGQTTIESMISPREPKLERLGFACAFMGNPEPMRLHALKALKSIGRVDVYGRAFGRPVRDKVLTARNYRYILSFENDLYPGYVTEKALDGIRTGCIPIYRGADPALYFNTKAMIDCGLSLDLTALIARIQELESDTSQRASILEQPVLTRRPTLDSAISLLRRTLDE